jgi:uncharacterized protein YjbI with pentapeptide repeats
MNRVFNEGLKFENQKYHDHPLEAGEYEGCTFNNCDFSNSDLSGLNFLECEFRECNLSLAKLINTSFRETKFKNCKLLGLHFEECNNLMISFAFDGCTLDLASFCKLKMKKTRFNDSKVFEVDFTETDLSYSSFNNCDLERTIFRITNLEGVSAPLHYYSIDRVEPRQKLNFPVGLARLLDKYDINRKIV